MSIIASAILAAALPMFTPQTQTLEYEDTLQYEAPCTNEVSCLTKSEVEMLYDLKRKVDILYAEHTNRLARIEARRTAAAERKSAIDRVRENAQKRKSAMGKSSGGVKK